MKTGANKTDQVKIKNLTKDGKSIDFISKTLGISKKCVKAFVEPKKEAVKETK